MASKKVKARKAPVTKAVATTSKQSRGSKSKPKSTSALPKTARTSSVKSSRVKKPAVTTARAKSPASRPASRTAVSAKVAKSRSAVKKPTVVKVVAVAKSKKAASAPKAPAVKEAVKIAAPAAVVSDVVKAPAAAPVVPPVAKTQEKSAPIVQNKPAAPAVVPVAVKVAPVERPAAAATAAKVAPAKLSQRTGFKTHEFIVYPAHGVGQIIAIEEQEVAGFKLELFVINFIKDKMTLKVPMPKVMAGAIRKLAEPEMVKRSLDILTGRARIKRTMWSRRAQEYETKINSGDLPSIAEVVRDLFRSDAQPEQSYSERQLYEAAVDRMAREIAVVHKLTDGESLKLIESHLLKGPKRGSKTEAVEGVALELEVVVQAA